MLQREKRNAWVYVNGLRVAEEPNFLFSYNITSPTKSLRQALNRERTHVGRAAYTDRVKSILLESQAENVVNLLAEDLQRFQTGKWHDELQWQDVALHACTILNSSQPVIFLTSIELWSARTFVDRAQEDGYRVVVVPDTIRAKLPSLTDMSGQPIRDLGQYREEWQQSFQYALVPISSSCPTPSGQCGFEPGQSCPCRRTKPQSCSRCPDFRDDAAPEPRLQRGRGDGIQSSSESLSNGLNWPTWQPMRGHCSTRSPTRGVERTTLPRSSSKP